MIKLSFCLPSDSASGDKTIFQKLCRKDRRLWRNVGNWKCAFYMLAGKRNQEGRFVAGVAVI
jgi:hypothetical protein